MKRPNGCTWLDMEYDIACTLDQLPPGPRGDGAVAKVKLN